MFDKNKPEIIIPTNSRYNTVSSFYSRVKQRAFRRNRLSPIALKGEKYMGRDFPSSISRREASQRSLSQLVALGVRRSIERFSSRMRLVPLHVRPWR